MAKRKVLGVAGVIFWAIALSTASSRWRPCVEIKRELRIPCECAVTVSGELKNTLSVEVRCDRAVLSDDALTRLTDQTIVSFSQKYSGYPNLPIHLMRLLPEALENLDLSHNAIHRLGDRQLQGRQNLKELRLANNALGDNLNPIFSTNEFHDLSKLRLLDLSYNEIRSIEEGIFKGCVDLRELYLDYNNLTKIPVESLKGPEELSVLSLAGNSIVSIERSVFSSLGRSLSYLNLSNNELHHIEDGAFIGMDNLFYLNISHNYIHHLNSDAFKGAPNIQELDISKNFLENFPTEVLRHQKNLKFLNISKNLITELDRSHFVNLQNLLVLDLSYNNIERLSSNVFETLTSLVRLDLSFNVLRTIEESSFEGLTNLKWLSLQDNNILLMPLGAFNKLPNLSYLQLQYNRIAALTYENFHVIAPHLVKLSLTRNLIRELPPQFFLRFDRLFSVELSGNMISVFDSKSFVGVEDTLLYLDLSFNKLSSLEEMPLHNLLSLNLAGNSLKKISPNVFTHMNRLQYLNISNNPLYGGFPPIFPGSLVSVDASRTGLQVLPAILLLNLEKLERALFAGNKIQKLSEATFRNANLTHIDLSDNEIKSIESGTFMGLRNLYHLNLRGNKLETFAGEYFNTGTGLQILDLSDNSLEHLSLNVFLIHPRLREINLSNNRLTVFPNKLIQSLQFLEYLNLSGNLLRVIGEFSFSQVAYLRILDLSNNHIEYVDELAFHNSTQLQRLDLSKNHLDNLSERMMEGVIRVEKLNLRENRLKSLPDSIFDPSRIRSLEKIDLSDNRFVEVPTLALQRQAHNLIELNIARNRLSEILTQDVVNSVQYLDLSENNLSEKTIDAIFHEAKVLRYLNIAFCGIKKIPKLEVPFLKRLNLSGNSLEYIESLALERTTMLEDLDISKNKMKSFHDVLRAFGSLSTLKSLDISGNDIKIINESSLVGFDNLRMLKMFNLTNCSRIEKSAFRSMLKLQQLKAFDFPKLGYFDIQGIIKNMNNLEVLDVEFKDLSVGSEQIGMKKHPRLKSLTLRGERLQNVFSSLLVGMKETRISLGLKNTSISSLPAGLLFPVFRSAHIELDIGGSKIATISPQLLAAFDERRGFLKLRGFNTDVKCDCTAKNLWKWLRNHSSNRFDNTVTCSSPKFLLGQSLTNLTEENLLCKFNENATSFQRNSNNETEFNTVNYKTWASTGAEPEIIWTVAPVFQDLSYNHETRDKLAINTSGMSSSIDDTIILGIVGGVVLFISIVIIVICISRVKCNSPVNAETRLRPLMPHGVHEASMLQTGSTHSGKINPEHYVNSYNDSTLGNANSGTFVLPANTSMSSTPLQVLPFVQPMSIIHTSAGSQPIYGCYDNLPIYITASENKYD